MGKSKVRGGKKAHRKRVENRNIAKKNAEESQKKMFMEQLQKMQDAAMVEEDVNGIVDGDDLDLGLDLDLTEATEILETATVEAEIVDPILSEVKEVNETIIMDELSPSETN